MDTDKSPYFQSLHQNLGSDLYLLQINPDISANLGQSDDAGYLFSKIDGEWVRLRKMTSSEHDQAWDQVSDMTILDAARLDQSKDLSKQNQTMVVAKDMDAPKDSSALGLFDKFSKWVDSRRNRAAETPKDSRAQPKG